ncbi:class F sortase [Streptomyces sp. NPDC096176]|uniref:class F sortase n=1 Tax=Streptomyces sp. NPDC096176 TaxID=3366079 RepID=UPI00380CBAA1
MNPGSPTAAGLPAGAPGSPTAAGATPGSPEPSQSVVPGPSPAPRKAKPVRGGHAPLPRSAAKKLTIPAITIESPVTGLGLDKHRRLAAPPVDNPRLVGWYRAGPSPGEAGTALLVGHRDTRTGPAIFLNLNALKPGDKVNVVRADRRTAVFTVDKVRTYKKEAFPDAEVYGHTGRPELRLLTCGGSFDKKAGYSANVVVFAHLTDVKQL